MNKQASRRPRHLLFLTIPTAAIPDGITRRELRDLGGHRLARTEEAETWKLLELPARETWKRWRKELGVLLLASSWRELRDQLTPARRARFFRAKVVREVEGRKLVGFVLEKDILETDRVLSRGRAPGRRG